VTELQLDYEFEWDEETGELLTPVEETGEAPRLGPPPLDIPSELNEPPSDPVAEMREEIASLREELASVRATTMRFNSTT